MTKLLTVIAATLVAIASVATGAEAAFNVRLATPAGFNQVHKTGCGGGGYRRAYRKRIVRQSVRRSAPKVQTASRTIEKPAVVAKAEPKAAPVETAAEFENSSISTSKEVAEAAVATPADVPVKKPAKIAAAPAEEPAKKVASAIKEVGCKSFFATVGMTLSVPCAK